MRIYKAHQGPINIQNITYHRNGSFGDGFYTVTFTEKDGGTQQMMAVVFRLAKKPDPRTAVFNLGDVASNPEAQAECFRGSYYHEALLDAIFDDQFERLGSCDAETQRESKQETQRREKFGLVGKGKRRQLTSI